MSGNQVAFVGRSTLGKITEFELDWKSIERGSTHELAMTRDFIFVTGQNMHQIAKLNYDGK